jgi:polyketide cyclase/dehydrase/lipid transport protein
LPRFAAERVLLAPVADVWAFLAEPYHLSDWWPGVSGVQPDRRGMAPGARWQVLGPDTATFLRRPDAAGVLLVLDVVPMQRISFQLTGQRLDAGLEVVQEGPERTRVRLAVEAPFLMVKRSFPTLALARLYDLVQTAADIGAE